MRLIEHVCSIRRGLCGQGRRLTPSRAQALHHTHPALQIPPLPLAPELAPPLLLPFLHGLDTLMPPGGLCVGGAGECGRTGSRGGRRSLGVHEVEAVQGALEDVGLVVDQHRGRV